MQNEQQKINIFVSNFKKFLSFKFYSFLWVFNLLFESFLFPDFYNLPCDFDNNYFWWEIISFFSLLFSKHNSSYSLCFSIFEKKTVTFFRVLGHFFEIFLLFTNYNLLGDSEEKNIFWWKIFTFFTFFFNIKLSTSIVILDFWEKQITFFLKIKHYFSLSFWQKNNFVVYNFNHKIIITFAQIMKFNDV